MVSCISNKKLYPTLEIAEDALIEARINFEFASNSGPVAVYKCEDCGQYHLTSQGKMSERLAKLLAEGKIDRLKQANQWEQKIKKR